MTMMMNAGMRQRSSHIGGRASNGTVESESDDNDYHVESESDNSNYHVESESGNGGGLT